MPIGAKLKIGSADAAVTFSTHAGQPYVEIHFEVPSGTEIQLEEDLISIAGASGEFSRSFRFPSISLVDTPIVNSYSPLPALKAQQRPTLSALTGATVHAGSNVSGRHFWLATYVQTDNAPTLLVTLPKLRVNAESTGRVRLEFARKQVTAVALINC